MIGQLFAKLAAFFVNHTVAAVAASVVVCSAVAVPAVVIVNNIVEESRVETEQSSVLENDISKKQKYEAEENSADNIVGADSQVEESEADANYVIEEKQEVTDSQREESSMHVHEYTVQSVQSTCVKNGVDTYTCQCGDSYIEESETTGHDYSMTEQAATCTENGYQTYTCSKCTYTYTEEITANGHAYEVIDIKDPTCMETGYQTNECSVCGYDYTEELDICGHIYDEWAIVVKPTEVKEGLRIRRCIWCSTSQTEAIPPNETHIHDWGNWSISVAPTEEAEGERVRWCACGASDTEVLPLVGTITETEPGHEHDYRWMGDVSATCVDGGYAIFGCACGTTYNDWFTDPWGHDWPFWEIVTEATAETDGVRKRTCQRCGYEEVESFEMPVDEKGQEFVSYIDPRLKIDKFPGCISYTYRLNDDGDFTGVSDFRDDGYGGPIQIYILEDGTLDIYFMLEDGYIVNVWCSAVIGYGHDLCIDVGGSFWDNWFNFDGEG